MNRLSLLALPWLLCLLPPAFACEGEDWIRMEVIAGEIAGHEVAQWVEVDRDGCVLSRFPSWDLRAGIYQRQLTESERVQLASLIDGHNLYRWDADAEREALREADRAYAKVSGEGPLLFSIQDGDLVHLRLAQAGAVQHIRWLAPDQEQDFRQRVTGRHAFAKSRGLNGLDGLVQTLQTLRRLADHPDKSKLAEVQP